MSRTYSHSVTVRDLTHAEIDRLLAERKRRATTSEVCRYWRLMDRALVLSLRDPARAARYAAEARSLASQCGRPDLAYRAHEIATLVGGW